MQLKAKATNMEVQRKRNANPIYDRYPMSARGGEGRYNIQLRSREYKP